MKRAYCSRLLTVLFFSYFLPSSLVLCTCFYYLASTDKRWGVSCYLFLLQPPISHTHTHKKKVIFALPCRLGEVGAPIIGLAANYSTVHADPSLCCLGSVTGMVFPFVYSHDTPKYGGRDKEQFFNNVVIPRIISWVSTTTFQLFRILVVISLVSSSPCCVLFTTTPYVTTRLYSARIKQNKKQFLFPLAQASSPNVFEPH